VLIIQSLITLAREVIIFYGGPWLTVPELFFEKKELIPALQQLLVSYLKPSGQYSSP